MDWLKTEGQSMHPFLNSGDWIAVEWREPTAPPPEKALQPGQLLLGRDPLSQEWLVHRLIRQDLRPPRLWMKGDASFCWDDLDSSQIWGVIVGIRPQKADGSSAPALTFKPNWIDRWIAWVSGQTLPPEKIKARLARRLLFALAHGRKKWLRMNSRLSSSKA